MDLINLLYKQGFEEESVHYLELENGKHDVATWAKAFPEFLKWGWGLNG